MSALETSPLRERTVALAFRSGPTDAATSADRSEVAKRAFDIVVGSILAILVTPFVLLCAIWLAVTLRAIPFFVQERIGRNGEVLHFLKLRTLPTSAPRYALKPEISAIETTRFARFLRVQHLDELTQLYLVPFGKLSLVGPRPKMPDAVEPVDAYYGAVRTRVPQGCTGLWQIGAHKHLLPNEAPQYDYFYVRQSTFRMDLWILWRTFLVMLHLGGTVEPTEVPAAIWRTGPDTTDSTVIDLRDVERSTLQLVPEALEAV